MTKRPTTPAAPGKDKQSGTTPVQFLPSAMLSWRVPIMATHGLPAAAGSKAQSGATRTGLKRAAPRVAP